MKPRVILIRENAETVTCGECSLEGIEAFGSGEVSEYAQTQRVMNEIGALYIALRREFGDKVEIDVVDPRNELFLIPVLVGDYRRYHPPFGAFLKTLLFGISPCSIIVNGTVKHVGDLPSPESLVKEVRAHLDEPKGGGETVPRSVKAKSFLKILLAGLILAICCGLLFSVR